ncbi:poly-gamma-glutamate hydrolase family protein [Halopiger goleimassiliensis]|uniref:poly-gamma-glutamate hydrolase family protein n=1 Tax=Halopiger goleimassiliensis TaxID=1293048 RepID=UPI000677DAA9|nr:poly-gamma-glutamate hydrolase family protein [Halopiger goleimassiliensis]
MSRPTLTTRPLEVTETGHYVELLYDDGATDEVCCCAAHGGSVEPGTAELALELATDLPAASCWACLGEETDGRAFDSWHPPSSAFSPAEYPLLDRIADRGFETVVSVHGLADDEVLVGGRIDRAVKRGVASALEEVVDVPVSVVTGGQYGGVSPNNFVNWLAREAGGLQLELGPTARSTDADDVRSVLEESVVSGPLAP